MHPLGNHRLRLGALLVAATLGAWLPRPADASDHLDTPAVIADPAADIGDVFAWTSADGRRVNLVMDVVAHTFSDQLQYVFHVDSGKRFGATSATTLVLCRFDAVQTVACWVGGADYARGDASRPEGIAGRKHRFRVFAGLRNDPFFNNVRGTRAAYTVAATALQHGATLDETGCPRFDEATSRAILDAWRHTEGGEAKNFLAGWNTSALVLSIDLDVVSRGGKLLAVWGAVHKAPAAIPAAGRAGDTERIPPPPALGEQIERTARPLIKNALVGGPLEADAVSAQRKERYNRVPRTAWGQFTPYIEDTLALYDGFDGRCGDQWLASAGPARYHALAGILADDRLWVDTRSRVCEQFLAVELAALGATAAAGDCGGRTPNYDASNVFRSLLGSGTLSGIDDGLRHPDRSHSTTEFPFLAAP